jgi:hypothetical protein
MGSLTQDEEVLLRDEEFSGVLDQKANHRDEEEEKNLRQFMLYFSKLI